MQLAIEIFYCYMSGRRKNSLCVLIFLEMWVIYVEQLHMMDLLFDGLVLSPGTLRIFRYRCTDG